MTNEEMIQKYYDGDDSMLEKLYNENIGFIHSIAKEAAVAFNCFHKKRKQTAGAYGLYKRNIK